MWYVCVALLSYILCIRSLLEPITELFPYTTLFRSEDADAPFVEDRWQRVRVGDVTFRFAEYCDRCVLPTIDVDTLESAKEPDRKSTRLNSSHVAISYAVFCSKKKKNKT